ncbi:hypothetical protein BDF19DRAFT_424277 [Syncephalis fuscata]|nr:hypothetical protein BDF19DRAFT_424277 [Syncephalis fuscata]
MPKAKKTKLKQALSSFQQRQAKVDKQKAAKEWQEGTKAQQSKAAAAAQLRTQERLEANLYTPDDTILLVGEGNFARALAEHHLAGQGGHLVATAYDEESVARAKYENEVGTNIDAIRVCDGTVLFDVDGTELTKCKLLHNRKFTKIVFNFPHAGAGIKDQDRNIRVNQELLLGFFASSVEYLATKENGHGVDGEIHITLKSGEPYDSWQVRKLARAHRLVCIRTMSFRPECYPGYTHRRTLGFKKGLSASDNEEITSKNPRLLIFTLQSSDHPNKNSASKGAKNRRSEPRQVQHHNNNDYDNDDDSDKDY